MIIPDGVKYLFAPIYKICPVNISTEAVLEVYCMSSRYTIHILYIQIPRGIQHKYLLVFSYQCFSLNRYGV